MLSLSAVWCVIIDDENISCFSSSTTISSVVGMIRGNLVVAFIRSFCQTGTSRGALRDLELNVVGFQAFVFSDAIVVRVIWMGFISESWRVSTVTTKESFVDSTLHCRNVHIHISIFRFRSEERKAEISRKMVRQKIWCFGMLCKDYYVSKKFNRYKHIRIA